MLSGTTIANMGLWSNPGPPKYRSLSSRFSIFTGVLLLWVVGVTLWWDIRQHTFDWTKGMVLCGIVAMIAAAISRFTIRLLARPLALLEAGITSVRKGQLEPIQVSRTGDEIEYLGESFNRMIEALAASQEEIRLHQELLEDRIRQRTEELERAMHGALNASQAKSEFLANMSHELRTPMNGLLGMLDLALDGGVNGEQKDQLETAQRCAYSLLALLNDILDLSKIEAGKMMLEKIPFEARAVVEDCVKSQAAKAAQKKIDLRFEADPGPHPTLLGDPSARPPDRGESPVECHQVHRSRQGAGEAGALAQRRRTASMPSIQVTDTGPGIPSDKLSNDFRKIHASRRQHHPQVRRHGPRPRHHPPPGRNSRRGGACREQSRQRQHLPRDSSLRNRAGRSASNAQPAPNEIRGETLRPPATARLLLVEDNLVNQKVVLAILRKKGYHIDVANDGREALTKLAAADSGNRLRPGADGRPDAGPRRPGSHAPDPHAKPAGIICPVVAMTAHAMNGDRERCLQSGMNAYISKPVQPAHLIATIERQLASGDRRSTTTSSPLERVLTDR